MGKAMVGFRHKGGHAIHDGDCHFWSRKICTCGLLHQLSAKHEPAEYYPAFDDEMLQHERALNSVPQ